MELSSVHLLSADRGTVIRPATYDFQEISTERSVELEWELRGTFVGGLAPSDYNSHLVLRQTYSDSSEVFWRIMRVKRVREQGDPANLVARPLWVDLDNRAARVTLGDQTSLRVTLTGVTAQAALDRILGTDLGVDRTLFRPGTVASAVNDDDVFLSGTNTSHFELVRELARAVEGEIEFAWDSANDRYDVNLVQRIGDSSPGSRVITETGANLNRKRLLQDQDGRSAFSTIVPVGTGQETVGLAGAWWGYLQTNDNGDGTYEYTLYGDPIANESIFSDVGATDDVTVTSPDDADSFESGSEVNISATIANASGDMETVKFFEKDTQGTETLISSQTLLGGTAFAFLDWEGTQVNVLSVTEPNKITVDGELAPNGIGQFRDVDGNQIYSFTDIDAEAAIGRVEKRAKFSGVAPATNRLVHGNVSADLSDWSCGGANEGACGWFDNPTGATVTLTETTAELNVDFGTSSMLVDPADGAGVITRAVPIAPIDEAGNIVSCWVQMRVLSGSVKVQMVDAAGGQFPSDGQDQLIVKSTLMQSYSLPGFQPNASGSDPHPKVRIVFYAEEPGTEFVVDAATLTQTTSAVEYSADMGPNSVFILAGKALREAGRPADAFEGEVYDLGTLGIAADEIDLGDAVTIELGDESTFTARVVEIREIEVPGNEPIQKEIVLDRTAPEVTDLLRDVEGGTTSTTVVEGGGGGGGTSGSGVPESRTLTMGSGLLIDGGPSATLAADRTITLNLNPQFGFAGDKLKIADDAIGDLHLNYPLSSVDVDGGAIDNTPIGQTDPAVGDFTALVANTLDTGQGANELYAMDQDVQTTDTVSFSGVTMLAGDVGTDNFVSQTQGFNITYAGAADFRTIFADELRVNAFTAEVSQALAGEDILTKSVGVLSRDFDVPSNTGTGTLYVEDLEGLPGTQVFSSGDTIRLRVIDRSGGGLVVDDVWGTVSSYSDLSGGEQSWTFTTGDDGGVSGNTVYAGTVALDYGDPGDPIIERTVLDSQGSPYQQMKTWNGSAGQEPTGYDVFLRSGNLNGIAGYSSDTPGSMFGDPDGQHMTVDASNGLRMRDGTTVLAQLSSTELSLGVNGQIRLQADGDAFIEDRIEIGTGARITNANDTFRTDEDGYSVIPTPSSFDPTQGYKFLEQSTGSIAGSLEADMTTGDEFMRLKVVEANGISSINLDAFGNAPSGAITMQAGSGGIELTSNSSNIKLQANTGEIVLVLPTSDPTEAGALWNDGGTVKVSAG